MTDLLALTAQLVDIPSVSRSEEQIADFVVNYLSPAPWLKIDRIGNTILARTAEGWQRRIAIAGHLDTVPPSGNERAVIEGDTCRGLGSVDMKGGLAVMLALAVNSRPTKTDVTFIFYACEEVASSENSLRILASQRPDILECDSAILCEPTGGMVEAGCQGSIRVRTVLTGTRAHTARPWMGKNAIHRLHGLIRAISEHESRTVLIDGCEFRESIQAVGVSGGVAGNVVPDRAELVINLRTAPDIDEHGALTSLRAVLGSTVNSDAGDTVEVIDSTMGALPRLDNPLIAELVALSGVPAKAKLGLTDVSLFAEIGVSATNFGPGDSSLAHTESEVVSRQELTESYRVMAELIGSEM